MSPKAGTSQPRWGNTLGQTSAINYLGTEKVGEQRTVKTAADFEKHDGRMIRRDSIEKFMCRELDCTNPVPRGNLLCGMCRRKAVEAEYKQRTAERRAAWSEQEAEAKAARVAKMHERLGLSPIEG